MPLPEGWQAKQLDRAGAWKERHFVRRTVYNRPIALEDLLGAVVVMGITRRTGVADGGIGVFGLAVLRGGQRP
jgi:hypothetical protein